jgi:lysyl-tRNA synthetase class 2
VNWRPCADFQTLRQRAQLLTTIRGFFAERSVLEVETPLLCSSGITDPSIEPLLVERGESLSGPRYLQTSPEYAMKRLLAAHGEPIFQIGKAFRDGEVGARHNPEFTLLEWYRPTFDHHDLMEEVAALIVRCLGDMPVHKQSYREVFQKRLAIDPLLADETELEQLTRQHVDVGNLSGDKDLWLDLLMSHVIEPKLVGQGMWFVYDFPASQASLSRIELQNGVAVGRRFELYIGGMELANGYLELTDAQEQRERFAADNATRVSRGQQVRPADECLLAALEHGLPASSGVALGIDRLLALRVGETDIQNVLSFGWQRS